MKIVNSKKFALFLLENFNAYTIYATNAIFVMIYRVLIIDYFRSRVYTLARELTYAKM